jgi:SAM-dependent methyltransferase
MMPFARSERKSRFKVKHDSANRALLNLGCGTRTDPSWNNLDFSPYARLRKRPRTVKALRAIGFLSDERYQRLQAIDPSIIWWNLVRGIPFENSTFDVVYHSHFLEHLERDAAINFLRECYRVLKPSGILRIVLPDLEALTLAYRQAMEGLDRWGETSATEAEHEKAIAYLFDQAVRRRSTGPTEQGKWVGRVEALLRGNAEDTGENHRWMYDRHSLSRILTRIGFGRIRKYSAMTSGIAGWERCFVDYNPDGTACKAYSLYLEATKIALAEARNINEKKAEVA